MGSREFRGSDRVRLGVRDRVRLPPDPHAMNPLTRALDFGWWVHGTRG